jgi:hypothetical protein
MLCLCIAPDGWAPPVAGLDGGGRCLTCSTSSGGHVHTVVDVSVLQKYTLPLSHVTRFHFVSPMGCAATGAGCPGRGAAPPPVPAGAACGRSAAGMMYVDCFVTAL